jgi:hypothetical protein
MDAHTDQLTVIRQGYERGIPVAVIAQQLGETRNAVIGKAYRAGLKHSQARPDSFGERTPARDLAIARCVVDAISISTMADLHDLNQYTINRIVAKHCICIKHGNCYAPSVYRWRDGREPR